MSVEELHRLFVICELRSDILRNVIHDDGVVLNAIDRFLDAVDQDQSHLAPLHALTQAIAEREQVRVAFNELGDRLRRLLNSQLPTLTDGSQTPAGDVRSTPPGRLLVCPVGGIPCASTRRLRQQGDTGFCPLHKRWLIVQQAGK